MITISPEDLASILSFLESRQAEPLSFTRGQVLQNQDTSREPLLVVSGSVRFLDSTQTFGSYTVSILEAPALIGVSPAFDQLSVDDCIASTDCVAYSLAGCLDDPFIVELVQRVWSQSITIPEYLFLAAKLRINGYLDSSSSGHNFSFFVDQCRLSAQVDNAFDLDAVVAFFADHPDRGFVYGQDITASIVNLNWPESTPPRLLLWSSRGWPELDSGLTRSVADQSLVSVDPPLPTFSEDDPSPNRSEQVESEVDTSNAYDFAKFEWNKVAETSECPASIISSVLKYYKVPVRKDVVAKANDFILGCTPKPTLRSYLSVFESIGLDAHLIQSSVSQVNRIPVPSLALQPADDGPEIPVLLVSTSSRGITILHPQQGFRFLSNAEIPTALSGASQFLHLESGQYTPQSTFGIHWVLPYLSRYKIQLVEVFIASFLTQLFALATPLLFQQIIDRVIGKGSHDSLPGLAILMVIFAFLEITFSGLRTFQFADVSNRIDISLGSTIVARMLRINARYFEKRPVGELSGRLSELDNIRRFLTGTALTVVLDVIFATLYIAVMFFYSVTLTVVILSTVPLLILATVGLTPITQKLLRSRAEAYAKSQSYMVELLNGIQTIKVQNSLFTARRKWEELQLQTINKGFKTVIANTASNNLLQFINKISAILIISVGSWLVIQNQLTLGELIAFRIISGYVTQPLLRLASTYQSFQETSLSVERLADLVNQPLESSPSQDSMLEMPELCGGVKFDSVSFSYSNSTSPQLAGVSLSIAPGSFVGLVGQSGCGKSTLLKLVPRLYSPSSGKVLIDNMDISKVDLFSLRKQLGFVPQDCLLFEGSIYSNIALEDADAESESVIRASRLACAHDFIMSLPQAYSTVVGEKGAGLSGGQRQRIALARMILSNPKMIILDEATSALDADTERQVVDNIRKVSAGKTLLMITHRLSTIRNADQIIVMDKGRVDCVGTHDELMAMGGRYYVLYQQQFAGGDLV